MKQKVFELLQQMHKEREVENRRPHYVTFRQLNERENIPNMRLHLRELYAEKRIEYGKTVNDVWFAPSQSLTTNAN